MIDIHNIIDLGKIIYKIIAISIINIGVKRVNKRKINLDYALINSHMIDKNILKKLIYILNNQFLLSIRNF